MGNSPDLSHLMFYNLWNWKSCCQQVFMMSWVKKLPQVSLNPQIHSHNSFSLCDVTALGLEMEICDLLKSRHYRQTLGMLSYLIRGWGAVQELNHEGWPWLRAEVCGMRPRVTLPVKAKEGLFRRRLLSVVPRMQRSPRGRQGRNSQSKKRHYQ